MMKTCYCVSAFLCLTYIPSHADFEWTQQASAVCPTVGESNRVLIMLPGNKTGIKPVGKFYDISIEGTLTIRWEIDWYSDASQVFILNDSLVRIRPIVHEPERNPAKLKELPLLEFYQKGKLIKSYKVFELGNIGENFGKSDFSSSVYTVFAVHEQLSPKIVTQLDYEVNTLDQYNIIKTNAIDTNAIFKVDVIGGDRIFFCISTGQILHRFKYKFTDNSVFRKQ